ncbi:MAG: NAD(P)/FAD-dependent oxidoreductase [Bacillota bacterium]
MATANVVAVIGAGAAGMMAAAAAAGTGAIVTVYERNRMAGKKILVSGKGRCNFTNDCSVQELVEGFGPRGRFLYSALSSFGPAQMCALMENLGVAYKIERGRRVFPASDRASDVRDALYNRAVGSGARFMFGRRIARLALEGGSVVGVIDTRGASFCADAVICASGGASYPATGSTGDGYALARQAGHSVNEPMPALVPMETVEEWPRSLAGLALRNVEVTLLDGDRASASEFGEMLFTHYGVGGPIILTLSRAVCRAQRSRREVRPGRFILSIDLKPALSEASLDRRVQRDLAAMSRKQLKNSLDMLLPKALIPAIIEFAEVDETTPANQVTAAQRAALVGALKQLRLTVLGPRPLEEAIVTSGGVELGQVDPRTMESKLAPGLFFAGEVLDIDGPTGGYNLQAAFSTGRLAGVSAARQRRG